MKVWLHTHLHATALATVVVVVVSLRSTTPHATSTAHATATAHAHATSHSTSATHSTTLVRIVTSAASTHAAVVAHAATTHAHAALLSVKFSTLHKEHKVCIPMILLSSYKVTSLVKQQALVLLSRLRNSLAGYL